MAKGPQREPIGATEDAPAEISQRLAAVGATNLGLDAVGMRGELERKLFGAPLERPKIGRYLVLERIGEGGLGVVYAAYDPELDRRVALKVMRADPEARDQSARLVREARALARLDHPNVVSVYDVGEEGDSVFVAMELLRGDELGTWLAQARRSWREILRVFVAAGRGLEAAHAKQIVHRDFKPANVLVGRDGRVRVLDFGLARMQGTPVSDESRAAPVAEAQPPDADLTRAKAVLGTPAYMAPEQHRGEVADERSDVYAFCSALYEALAGERPFRGDTLRELAESKQRALDLKLPGAPGWLVRVLTRGLAPDRGNRYASMGALLADLEGARRRRIALVGLAIVALGAATIGGGMSLARAAAHGECQRLTSEVNAVWNAGVRDRIVASFEATGRDHATRAASFVSGALDRYADTWRAEAAASCEATLLDHERSASEHAAIRACLDHRIEAIEVLTAVLEEVQPDALGRTVEAVDALPPVEECRSPTVLRVENRGARRKLLEAATLRMATRRDEAVAAANAALEAGEAAGDLGLQAAAQVELAWIDFERGRMDRAQAAIRAGLKAAERSGEDGARARGWVLNGVIAHMQGRPSEAELSADMADTILLDHPQFLRLRISAARMRSLVLTDRRELDAAMAIHQQTAAQIRELFGDEHPMIGKSHMDGAVVLQLQGKLDEAKAAYLAALDMYERTSGSYIPQVPRLLANLGALAQTQQRPEEAKRYLLRSIEIVEVQFGPDHLHAAPGHHNLALVLNELGEHEQARQRLEKAIAIRERSAGPHHKEIAGSLVELARTHAALGRPEKAAALLERVLDFPDSAEVSLDYKASAWFSLAKLVAVDQPKRAHDLASKALEVRKAEDPEGELATAIAAWLAEH